MLHDWWTWTRLQDTLNRFYGYDIKERAPIYINPSNGKYRLAKYDTDNKIVTFGHDQLTLEQAYRIALAHLRVPVLLKCVGRAAEDGTDEYSSVTHGLTGYGRIIDSNEETLVEWDDENFANSTGDKKHAADELYALLLLCRQAKDNGVLTYDRKRAWNPVKLCEEVLHVEVVRSAANSELMP